MSLDPTQLGDAMANAMPDAWQQVKGQPFPLPSVPDDAKVLFRAVALGLLTYLKAHTDSVKTVTLTIPVTGDVTYTVKSVAINTP
jgi:hypothetical protein